MESHSAQQSVVDLLVCQGLGLVVDVEEKPPSQCQPMMRSPARREGRARHPRMLLVIESIGLGDESLLVDEITNLPNPHRALRVYDGQRDTLSAGRRGGWVVCGNRVCERGMSDRAIEPIKDVVTRPLRTPRERAHPEFMITIGGERKGEVSVSTSQLLDRTLRRAGAAGLGI